MRPSFLRTISLLSILAIPAFALAAVGSQQPPQKESGPKREAALSNTDVLQLTSAKVPADIIVQKIDQAADAAFDVSTQGIVSLKKSGVEDVVIKAMLSRMNKAAAAKPEAPSVAQASPPSTEGESRMTRLRNRMKLGGSHDSSAGAGVKKPPETVKLFLTEKPSAAYRELGRVDAGKYNFAGISRSRDAVNTELQKKAGDLGADAIINITEDFASVSGVAIAFDKPQR